MRTRALLVAGLLALTMGGAAHAATWYVAPAPTGDDGNGGTAAEPFATINYAIESAAEGDEIRIQAGTYLENVRNDSAATGKNGLRFRGGYAADWSRDLKTNKSIIKAADASKPVFYVNTKTNLLNGLTLTGGTHGFQCELTDNGQYQYLYQCVISNNTSYGTYSVQSCRLAVASSLFYNNVIGAYGGQVNSQPLYFYNCTFVGHSNAALYHGDEYGRPIYAYNCVFDDNKYHQWHNFTYDWEITATDCCLGSVRAGGAHTEGKCQTWCSAQDTFYGNTFYREAGLNADFTLSATSYCLKRGSDQSANEVFPYGEDLVGNAWGSAWDMGCFKSDSPLVALPNNTDVYVSPTGDDANSGLDAEHPKKTILNAVNTLGEYGTCHLANGTYPAGYTCLIHRPGIRVFGESREGTIVMGKTATANAARGPFYVNAPSVVISNMTLVGGTAGVVYSFPPMTSNCVVSCCTMSNGYYGVRARHTPDVTYPGCYIRISKCVFANCIYAGAYLESPVVMDNCLSVSNKYDGINWYVFQSRGGVASVIANCTMLGNKRGGFYCNWDSTEKCRLFNCILADNVQYGAYRDSQRNYHRYTEFYNCAFKGNGTDYNVAYLDGSEIHDPIYPEDLGFMTRPGFEYVPARESPLIKKGITNSNFSTELILTDLAERPRRNWKIDLGAYQHSYFDGQMIILR